MSALYQFYYNKLQEGVMISFEQFNEVSKAYNVIPLTYTMLADVHTPVSLYMAFRNEKKVSFLLESAEANERIGRFSFLGCDPLFFVQSYGNEVTILRKESVERRKSSITEVLKELSASFKQYPLAELGGFCGGFLGYVGYDTVAQFERIPLPVNKPYNQPDALFGFFDTIIRYDHRKHLITLIHNVLLQPDIPIELQYQNGKKKIEALKKQIEIIPTNCELFSFKKPEEQHDHQHFEQMVERAKHYIYEGDIFQVVLSRRVSMEYIGDTFPVYRALRLINPSPYLFYLDFDSVKLIGSSPEILVRVVNKHVEVFPIAGTRKRGESVEDDLKLEEELRNDEKELAEHHMLIDLGRNDVGRVCEVGSVHVPVNKRIDYYSHVMHLVSEVHGTLRSDYTSIDALQACFPAGTVTGAPKVRAMEIISELEKTCRCIYAGAVGYVGFDGTLDMCIAIRTIVATEGRLHIQAGAGIVADSVPYKEYLETQSKASALIEAIRLAASDFDLRLIRRGVA